MSDLREDPNRSPRKPPWSPGESSRSSNEFDQSSDKALPPLPGGDTRQAYQLEFLGADSEIRKRDDQYDAFNHYSISSKPGPNTQETLLQSHPSLPKPGSLVFDDNVSINGAGGRFGGLWNSWDSLALDTWFMEILSLIFSALCLMATFVSLGHFDDRPLPDWPYNITLNTLIALFVTLSTTALMGPVSQGISQLKWLWFTDNGKKALDLELYDRASRGISGSIRLMFHGSGKSTSSLGALITILVLAANTITQQTIRYVPRLVTDLTPESAICPRATFLDSYDPLSYSRSAYTSNPDAKITSAIDGGMLAGNATYPQLRLGCSTGNCTWPIYHTLGVCASVANLTDQIQIDCVESESMQECKARLRGVGGIRVKGVYISASFMIRTAGQVPPDSETDYYYQPHSEQKYVESVAFKDNLLSSVADFFVVWNADWTGSGDPLIPATSINNHGKVLGPQAAEVNLQFCVKTQESSVKRGHSSTSVHESYTKFDNIFDKSLGTPINLTAVLPATGEEYGASAISANSLFNYTAGQFHGNWSVGPDGVTLSYPTTGVRGVVSALMNPPFDQAGLEILANNMAVSMTNSFRAQASEKFAAVGRAQLDQTFVHVSWGWMTLLLVIEVLSWLFLALVIWENKKKGCNLWRASNLALVQALEHSGGRFDSSGRLTNNSAMQRQAKIVRLKLRRDGQSWKLHEA